MCVSKQVRIEFHSTWYVFSPMNCVGSWVILNISLVFYFVFAWTGRLWYLWISVAVPNTGSPLGTSYTGEWLVSFGLAEPSSPTRADAHLCIIDQFPPPSPPLMLDPRRACLPLPPKHPTSGKWRCGIAPHQDNQLAISKSFSLSLSLFMYCTSDSHV